MTVCSLLQNYKWCQLHLKPDLLLEEGWTVLKVTFQQGFHRIVSLLAFLVSVNNQLQERERKILQTPLLLLLTPTETESYATPACLFQTCATTSATTGGCDYQVDGEPFCNCRNGYTGQHCQEEDLGECCSPLSSLAGVSVATHPCCYMLVNVAIH